MCIEQEVEKFPIPGVILLFWLLFWLLTPGILFYKLVSHVAPEASFWDLVYG